MGKVKAVVLAAGKGTRLHSEEFDLPKVLREVNGQPMLHYVLEALSFLSPKDTILVVGYQGEKVKDNYKVVSSDGQKVSEKVHFV